MLWIAFAHTIPRQLQPEEKT